MDLAQQCSIDSANFAMDLAQESSIDSANVATVIARGSNQLNHAQR